MYSPSALLDVDRFTTLGGWASNNVTCPYNGPYHNSIDPVSTTLTNMILIDELIDLFLFVALRMFMIPKDYQDVHYRSTTVRISVS